MDRAWWRYYLDEVHATFDGHLVSPVGLQGVVREQFNHYQNSGAGAIALAAHWGADKIILLGYDCQVSDKTHWHGDHPGALGNAGTVRKWPAQFEQLRNELKGVRVVNCSRETALTCFPRMVLSSALSADRPDLIVQGMQGLGDNLYQRAFISQMPYTVYLETPWPQLYADLENVRPVRPATRLRTQAKNIRVADTQWLTAPQRAPRKRVAYGNADLLSGSIPRVMANTLGVQRPVFDLPPLPDCAIASDRPVAIIRPVVSRREWLNTARNPRPEYITSAAKALRQRGYYVVSVADLKDGEEWIEGEPPDADLVLHRGELGVMQLLAAIKQASVVVGGVGWIVPACIAAGTPLYVVLGGQLAHNAPEQIVDQNVMDLSRVGWAWPEQPCHCTSKTHGCNKVINDFDEKFSAWLDGQDLYGCLEQQVAVGA